MKFCLEYIWIDGSNTVRSKNRIIDISHDICIDCIPIWNFDGSSTQQATGRESDIILKPVRLYPNPFIGFIKSYLVLCETYQTDNQPHPTNHRQKLIQIAEKAAQYSCLFGIEQEYVLFERNKKNLSTEGYNLPYMWKEHNNPEIGFQSPYYCSVGGDRNFGRIISEEHMKLCLYANINICGTNSEVMASQWEFQIGTSDALQVSDDLWVARYILQRITEKCNCYVSFHPKPYIQCWNGSGLHTNFSTADMRAPGGIQYIREACDKLCLKHSEHMMVYGTDNHLRMSGLCETSDYNSFTYGVADRGCSVRIPISVADAGCGYLEDRRPASNANPYEVCFMLIQTICL